MEKLIELLNEYCKKKKIGQWSILENGYLFHGNKPIKNKKEEFDLLIISNHYGFIKWLVENNKIDLDKRPTRNKYRLQQYKTELGGYGQIDEYSELLMLLSIQDEPIEYLVSLLKNV